MHAHQWTAETHPVDFSNVSSRNRPIIKPLNHNTTTTTTTTIITNTNNSSHLLSSECSSYNVLEGALG